MTPLSHNPGDVVNRLGVKVVRATDRRHHSSVIYECVCLTCEKKLDVPIGWWKSQVRGKRKPNALACPECRKKQDGRLRTEEQARRAKAVQAAFAEGKTIGEIARETGVTKQRVHQLVTEKVSPDTVADVLRGMTPAELVAAVLALPTATQIRIVLRAGGVSNDRKGVE